MKRAGIVGLGLWVPDEIRKNDAWPASFARAFHEKNETRRSHDFTHIDRQSARRPYDELYVRHALPYENDPFKGATLRRVASPDVPTAQGDSAAASRALEDAGVDPRDVDLVLSSAIVPDRLVPSNGPAIQHLTGCTRAAGIGVESYCSSALAQLDLAAGLVQAGRARFVLCVQSHQIGRINDLESPMSPIFGDGSAAFVVGEVPPDRGLVRLIRAGDGSLAGAVTHEHARTPGATWWRDAEGPVRPGSADLVAARRIAENVIAFAIDTIRELCEATRTPLDTVAVVAALQPMVWYQGALADGLGIPAERVPSTYADYAHLGAAGVVANLIAARRRGILRDGAASVLYAHGAGLTRYAALLRWSAGAASAAGAVSAARD